MLFNSALFIFAFAPLAFAGFFLLGRFGRRNLAAAWLGLASLVFYGWDDPARLLPIILVSISFNFLVGRALGRKRRDAWLVLGLVGNLGLLGYYKYAAFLLGIFHGVTGAAVPAVTVALPIGISFFTFTQIAFLVDTRRGLAREYNPLHYLLFVSFFPHLIAGPILHHKEMMPQFEHARTYHFQALSFAQGLTWFGLGLAKKVLLADGIRRFVGPAFAAAGHGQVVSFADAWLGTAAFALQIYFDFSGYSDMAIGLALLAGVKFPLNFNSPYKAVSLIDFWRRWHMTLSRFLRDYLYIPLGGNRMGEPRRYANLMATMLLGGMWHGASWNFVLWGGLHGLGLAVNHLWREASARLGLTLPPALGRCLTLLFVVIAWIPFRAEDFPAARALWKGMLGLSGFAATLTPDGAAVSMAWVASLFALTLFAPNTQEIFGYHFGHAFRVASSAPRRLRWAPTRGWAVASALVFGAGLAVVVAQFSTEFIYFRF